MRGWNFMMHDGLIEIQRLAIFELVTLFEKQKCEEERYFLNVVGIFTPACVLNDANSIICVSSYQQ